MQIGFVGLGKMGGNMVHRIRRDSDHEVVAFDFDAEAVEAGRRARRDRRRARSRSSSRKLEAPRTVWIMVPAGRPDRSRPSTSSPGCSTEGDTIVDGGNSQVDRRQAPRRASCAEHGHPLRRRRHLAAASGASRSATA